MPKVEHRFSKYAGSYKQIPNVKVKHKGLFDMNYLYLLMHEWLVEEEYASRDDAAFPETFYLHRWSQGGGEEVRIWWRLEKSVNSFIKYYLDVDFTVIGLTKTEIMHNGAKYKANNGEVEVSITGTMIPDPNFAWRKSGLMKGFFEMFWKRMYKKNFNDYKNSLEEEVLRFREAIKTYVMLKNYLPESEDHRFYAMKEPGHS